MCSTGTLCEHYGWNSNFLLPVVLALGIHALHCTAQQEEHRHGQEGTKWQFPLDDSLDLLYSFMTIVQSSNVKTTRKLCTLKTNMSKGSRRLDSSKKQQDQNVNNAYHHVPPFHVYLLHLAPKCIKLHQSAWFWSKWSSSRRRAKTWDKTTSFGHRPLSALRIARNSVVHGRFRCALCISMHSVSVRRLSTALGTCDPPRALFCWRPRGATKCYKGT